MLIERTIREKIEESLRYGKGVVLLGPRRVGKTVLVESIAKKFDSALLLDGEDVATDEILQRKTVANYSSLLKRKNLLVVDEAQKIRDIGSKLKLIVDKIPDIKVLVTGSSSFDIENQTGEPLTGRKINYQLFPISETENSVVTPEIAQKDSLYDRLVFGSYPELYALESAEQKARYLREMVNSYLLKDILTMESIRNSRVIKDLLRLIAYQIGHEVSLQEIGSQLGISKNTVFRYLDILEKSFILYNLRGFSRNLRKEVSKNSRLYFLDNGIRNAIIADFNQIGLRNDQGSLWENFLVAERLKQQEYFGHFTNNYFWRTYDQQEIDWIEERNGSLFGYEFKWNASRKTKVPTAWSKAYPAADFEVINPDNYRRWLSN